YVGWVNSPYKGKKALAFPPKVCAKERRLCPRLLPLLTNQQVDSVSMEQSGVGGRQAFKKDCIYPSPRGTYGFPRPLPYGGTHGRGSGSPGTSSKEVNPIMNGGNHPNGDH